MSNKLDKNPPLREGEDDDSAATPAGEPASAAELGSDEEAASEEVGEFEVGAADELAADELATDELGAAEPAADELEAELEDAADELGAEPELVFVALLVLVALPELDLELELEAVDLVVSPSICAQKSSSWSSHSSVVTLMWVLVPTCSSVVL